jgi:hypothetical protein
MFKKVSILAAVFALATMAFAALAPVARAEEPQPQRDATLLRGRGVLDAHGDGLVAVRGRIDLYARADRGIMLVKDVTGDAAVRINGDGHTANWNGFTVYFGVEGQAHVTGSDVTVIIVGDDVDLHVVGAGWAFLNGDGTFEVNNRGPFRWTADGAFASIVAPPAE